MTTAQSSPRVDSLTGLRFVAAVAVLLGHLPPAPHLSRHLRTFMLSGYNGVTLFFVLSGFVLAWNYGDTLAEAGNRGRALRSYAVARIARIYPLYLFALAFAISPQLAAGRPLPHLWQHVLAVQTWSPDVSDAYSYNPPGWSVGVELFLYACFPLLVLATAAIRHHRKALWMLVALCVTAGFTLVAWAYLTGRAALPPTDPASVHRWLYRTPLTRLGDFTLGMAGAYLVAARPARPGRTARWGRAAQAVAVAGIVLPMTSGRILMSPASYDALYMLPMFLLIVGLAVSPGTLLARVLSTRTAVVLGEASYALYLLHKPLLSMLALPPQAGDARWLAAQLAAFAIVLCAALGAHLLVEKPAQRFIRRILDRRPEPAPAAPPMPAARTGSLVS
jgi:peptidoglycan/LPS O-acetylase OafA/YrhL